jgi:hypothetical protein
MPAPDSVNNHSFHLNIGASEFLFDFSHSREVRSLGKRFTYDKLHRTCAPVESYSYLTVVFGQPSKLDNGNVSLVAGSNIGHPVLTWRQLSGVIQRAGEAS